MFTQVPTEHFSVEDKVMFNVAKLTLMSKTIMQLRSYCSGSYPFVFNKSYHQLLCSLQVFILFELNAVALNLFAVTLPVLLCYKSFLSPAILFRWWARRSATGDPSSTKRLQIKISLQSKTLHSNRYNYNHFVTFALKHVVDKPRAPIHQESGHLKFKYVSRIWQNKLFRTQFCAFPWTLTHTALHHIPGKITGRRRFRYSSSEVEIYCSLLVVYAQQIQQSVEFLNYYANCSLTQCHSVTH
jgi:hypothetical protein